MANSFRMGPCKSKCCSSCDIFEDNFIRSDSTNIGSDWEEVSGDWSISSSTLLAAVGVVKCVTPHPDSTSHHKATAQIGTASANGRPQVIVNYKDSNNYLFGEVQIGSGTATLRLYRRSGGTDTLLVSASQSSTWIGSISMSVCFDGSVLVLTATSATGLVRSIGAVTTAITDGIYAGLGCANTSGTVKFSYFNFEKHRDADNPTCGECTPDCSSCCDPTDRPPARIRVTIGPGLTDNNCSYCDQVEGEYVLDHFPLGAVCQWKYESPACTITTGPCVAYPALTTPVFQIIAGIANDGFGNCTWRVTIRIGLLGSPDFVCVPATGSYSTSGDIPSGDCTAFPITVPRTSGIIAAMCNGSWPTEVTVDSF